MNLAFGTTQVVACRMCAAHLKHEGEYQDFGNGICLRCWAFEKHDDYALKTLRRYYQFTWEQFKVEYNQIQKIYQEAGVQLRYHKRKFEELQDLRRSLKMEG